MKALPFIAAAALFTTACGAQEYDVSSVVKNNDPDVVTADQGSTDEYPANPAQHPSHDSDNEATPDNPPPHSDTNNSFLELAQSFDLPEIDSGNESGPALWATYYYLPQVNAASDGYDLLDSNGGKLGPKLSKRDWCNAAMEGSIRVRFNGEEHTYNYAASNSKQQVDCSAFFPHKVGGTRFKIAKGSFGDGVKNYKLVPFRTIAVDSKIIPYGSIVYIPAARGIKIELPNGQTVSHDGYFFAGDTGSAIKQNHIDVFIGVAKTNPFSWIKSSASQTFDARIVENKELAAAMSALHTQK